MGTPEFDTVDPRIPAALAELEDLIKQRYPAASFVVFHGEDPDGMYLRVMVDIEDTDKVLDVVLDRLYEFQVEQGLPVHVVTTLPLERVAEQLRARSARPGARAVPPLS